MPYGLTPSLSKTFDALSNYVRQHGTSPTCRDLASMLCASSPGPIHRKLNALEERGYIRRIPGKNRSIEIIAYPSARKTPIVTSTALSRVDTEILVAEVRRRGFKCEVAG